MSLGAVSCLVAKHCVNKGSTFPFLGHDVRLGLKNGATRKNCFFNVLCILMNFNVKNNVKWTTTTKKTKNSTFTVKKQQIH